MNAFKQLLWREWRDNRALILVFFLAAPIGLGVAFEILNPTYPGPIGIELATLLFGCVLVADSMAREGQGGLGVSLARLPMNMRLPWLTSGVFVVGMSALFMGWMAVGQIVRQLLRGRELALLEWSMDPAHWWVGGCVILSVAWFANLTRRSFASALAGIGFGLGLPYLISTSSVVQGALVLSLGGLPNWVLPVLVPVSLLLASCIAFSPRGGVLARVWQRATASVLFTLFVASSAVAWSSVELVRELSVDPGGGFDLRWFGANPSPDGRFLALQAKSASRLSQGGGIDHSEVWIVDLEEGGVRQLEGIGSRDLYLTVVNYTLNSPWSDDGRLLLSRGMEFALLLETDPELVAFDPRTGEFSDSMAHRNSREFDRRIGRERWWERSYREVEGTEYRGFRWLKNDCSYEVPVPQRSLAAPEPGVVICADGKGAIVRWDMAQQQGIQLARVGEHPGLLRLSKDGRTLAVSDNSGLRLVDAHSGELLWGPGEASVHSYATHGDRRAVLVEYNWPDRRFLVVTDEGVASGPSLPRDLADSRSGNDGRLVDLDGKRWVYSTRDALYILDESGVILDCPLGPADATR